MPGQTEPLKTRRRQNETAACIEQSCRGPTSGGDAQCLKQGNAQDYQLAAARELEVVLAASRRAPL